MKKLYVSGNYIVYENGNGRILEYPKSYTVYTFRDDVFQIIEQSGVGIQKLSIPKSDIVNIFDKEGATAYSESSFIEFLRENSGFKSGGGNGILGVTLNRETLKEVATSNNKLVYVEEFDNVFIYSDALQRWHQIGENNILREGLISGSLYVNNIKAG